MNIFDIFYDNPTNDNLELIIERDVEEELLLDLFKKHNNELLIYVINYLYINNSNYKDNYNYYYKDLINYACQYNNIDILIFLININDELYNEYYIKYSYNYLPSLYTAIQFNNYDILKYLLNLPLKVTNENNINNIYTKAFVNNANMDIINLLMSYYPIDNINIEYSNIIHIVENGNIDIFMLLEKYDKNLYTKASIKEIFIESCVSGNLDFVKYILSIDKFNEIYNSYTVNMACLRACSKGSIDIVKFLFESLDIKPVLKYSNNGFIRNSLYYNHPHIFYYLLDLYKINNLYIKGSVLLNNALYGGNMDTIDYIMNNFNYLENRNVYKCNNALYYVCVKKDVNYIKFIVDLFEKINTIEKDKYYKKHGFYPNVNFISKYITATIFINSCHNSIDVMEYIYNKLSDKDKKKVLADSYFKTILEKIDNKEKLEFLLKNFYSVDLLDFYEILLYKYCIFNNIEIAKILCLYIPNFKIEIENDLIISYKLKNNIYTKYGINKNNIVTMDEILDCSICLENDNSDKKNKLLYLNCPGENKHIMHLQCLIISNFLKTCPCCINKYDIRKAKIVKYN